MRRIVSLVAALAVSGLSVGVANSAPIWKITFTGVVDAGTIDTGGLFGPVGADISGLKARGVVTYDVATLPLYESYTDPSSHDFYGANNSPIPSFSQKTVIDGVSYTVSGFDNADIAVYSENGGTFNSYGAFVNPFTNGANAYVEETPSGASPNVGAGVEQTFSLGAAGLYSPGSYSDFQVGNIHGSLTSFSIGAATPEPGAWALMLVGFGCLGARLRARGSRRMSPIG